MIKSKLLRDSYFNWLFKEYVFSDLEKNIVQIGTPFLDNQFDYIIMYAEFLNDNRINLTDDGWTLHELESRGVNFSSRNKTNNKLLKNIADSLGIEVINKELSIMTNVDKFPIAKQRLLQAIMQVNDLVVLQKNNVKNIFYEEVESLLNKNDVLYSPRPSYAAKGGITVQFDFSIPTKGNEKLIRTISNGNDLNRSKLLTMDTQLLKHSRPNIDYIAIYDDVNNPVKDWGTINNVLEENSSDKIIALPISSANKDPKLLLNNA